MARQLSHELQNWPAHLLASAAIHPLGVLVASHQTLLGWRVVSIPCTWASRVVNMGGHMQESKLKNRQLKERAVVFSNSKTFFGPENFLHILLLKKIFGKGKGKIHFPLWHSLSQPVGEYPFGRLLSPKIFALWFITIPKLQLWGNNKNNFMAEGTSQHKKLY